MKASDGETVMRPAVIVDSENGNLKLKGDKIVNGKAVEFEGWLDPDNVVYANLAELNTDIDYDITNAYKSIFIVGDGTSYFNKNNNSYSSSSSTKGTNKCESTTYNKTNANTKYKSSYSTLPKITNKKLYTYDRFDGKNDGKVYSKKLGKNIFVAPVLWKFAKQIGYAECVAQRNGYDLKIYDTYRPQDICDDFYAAAVTATKSGAGNSLVTRTIAGRTWGLGWFVANSNRTTSDHARGIAVDLTLVRKDNNKEITTQSNMHDLSCNSIKTVSGWDNTYTNVLNKIMTVSNSKKSTMDTLVSEWWHYNITNSANYSATKYNVYYPTYTK
jgi:D-alanyl-D-alanine dipeptidase